MNITELIENIPPAYYGVLLGSFLTIIGVVLTNISTTKRLHIQHQYEREQINKERDLSMRRDVYLGAMEAISAGLVAVSRFSDLEESPDALMQTYTDLSPKIGKVTIVGHNETINAFANFNLELTGAFLRLSSKREKVNALVRKSMNLEGQIQDWQEKHEILASAPGEINDLPSSLISDESDVADNEEEKFLMQLNHEYEETENQLMQSQVQLVKICSEEVAAIDQLLVPLISLVRTELELPFDKENYAEILEKGHKKQMEYLDAFFENLNTDNND